MHDEQPIVLAIRDTEIALMMRARGRHVAAFAVFYVALASTIVCANIDLGKMSVTGTAVAVTFPESGPGTDASAVSACGAHA